MSDPKEPLNLPKDSPYMVWEEEDSDMITLVMADRGITLLFTRAEWYEFLTEVLSVPMQ